MARGDRRGTVPRTRQPWDQDGVGSCDREVRRRFEDTVLIGGPPCQAYSLAGRARSRGKQGYVPEEDERHYLFREYIRVLDNLRPAAFVMENVKGMLSSTVESRLVFEMLIEDLSSLGMGRGSLYELHAITVKDGRCHLSMPRDPSDFVVRADAFGFRSEDIVCSSLAFGPTCRRRPARVSVRVPEGGRPLVDVIGDLPALRSGLSRGGDSPDHWTLVIQSAAERLAHLHRNNGQERFYAEFSRVARRVQEGMPMKRSSRALPSDYGSSNEDLRRWLRNENYAR